MERAGSFSKLLSLLRKHAVPLAVLAAIVAGLWLRGDTIGLGFHSDDHAQIAMLRGEFPAPRGALDLFRLADGSRDGQKLTDHGYLPWWSHPELKLALFRPLSSALFALDDRLFGTKAVYAHVHTLAWWILVVLGCGALFRAILPARVAVVAVLLFAIEEAHTVPVAWLANRNTLVSTAFGVFGLLLHVRYRQGGSLAPRVGEALLFTLALAGGEYAVSMLAYVAAFELFAHGDARERLRALTPAIVAFGVYVAARALFGFGVSSSGYYISPAESPLRFAAAALQRVPVLVGDLIFGIPAVWWAQGMPWVQNYDAGRNWQSFLGTGALIAFVIATIRIDRSSEKFRSLRWLCAGAVLSVVPGAGALPEDRTLVAASLGASALLAVLLVQGYDAALKAWRLRGFTQPLLASLAIAAAVLFVHVHLAWARSRDQIHWLGVTIRAQRGWALGAAIPDQGAAERRVVIISGADFTTNANLPWVRLVGGHPTPRSYWRLSGAVAPHEILRVAPAVIEVEALTDRLDNTMVGSLYRPEDAAFRVGDAVTIDGLRVEVLSTIGPHPHRTRFTFERSLDDPSYLFLHSTPLGLRSFSLPAVGEKLEMPPPAGPRP